MEERLFRVAVILALISVPEILVHNVALANLGLSETQMIDDYVWVTDAISADGLSNYGLPGRTAAPPDAGAYNGFGRPYWTGNFSLNFPITSVNFITVHALPFTPDEYTYNLTEGTDFVVHADDDLIELLTPLDVPITNEHWKDGVNTSLLGWALINYVASGIESVWVDMNNGTTRFGRNWGYAVPPPSEWFYDPDWPRELTLWQLIDYCLGCPGDWPPGSEWWINYTAASYLTVNYDTPTLPAASATIDIVSSALNLQSKGQWILCHIELPMGYNASDIDPFTIELNNTVAGTQMEVGDVDNDTVSDLAVAFNRTEVVDYILSQGVTCGNVALTLTGRLTGKPQYFRGSVTIEVSSVVGDVNCNGAVDIYDVVTMLAAYGCQEGEPGWNPNANFAPSWNVVDIFDIVIIASHYGES